VKFNIAEPGPVATKFLHIHQHFHKGKLVLRPALKNETAILGKEKEWKITTLAPWWEPFGILMISAILTGYLSTFRTILWEPEHRADYLGLIVQEFLMRGYPMRSVRGGVALMEFSAERQTLLGRLKRVKRISKQWEGADVYEELEWHRKQISNQRCEEPTEREQSSENSSTQGREEELSSTLSDSDAWSEIHDEDDSLNDLCGNTSTDDFDENDYDMAYYSYNQGGGGGGQGSGGWQSGQGGHWDQGGGDPNAKIWNGQHWTTAKKWRKKWGNQGQQPNAQGYQQPPQGYHQHPPMPNPGYQQPYPQQQPPLQQPPQQMPPQQMPPQQMPPQQMPPPPQQPPQVVYMQAPPQQVPPPQMQQSMPQQPPPMYMPPGMPTGQPMQQGMTPMMMPEGSRGTKHKHQRKPMTEESDSESVISPSPSPDMKKSKRQEKKEARQKEAEQQKKTAEAAMASFQERLIASTATASQILAGSIGKIRSEKKEQSEEDEIDLKDFVLKVTNYLKGAKKDESYIDEVNKVKDPDSLFDLLAKLNKKELCDIAGKATTGTSVDLRMSKIKIISKIRESLEKK